MDDWTTFYQASTRLVEYLNHVGYNGLMLSVVADGSSIYPSQHLQPTPRHDTGAFFASGQDPLRKDALELLLRVFDREGLRLIPAIQFSHALPEIEALRHGDAAPPGIEWIGSDGLPWVGKQRERAEQTPSYNPLDPRVQQAMLNVVRELAQAYGDHPSFAGIALQLSSESYAVLPTPDGGYDDETVARFNHDMRMDTPGDGPNRFAQRARYLNGSAKTAWYTWRANQLAAFHHRLQEEIAACARTPAYTWREPHYLNIPIRSTLCRRRCPGA